MNDGPPIFLTFAARESERVMAARVREAILAAPPLDPDVGVGVAIDEPDLGEADWRAGCAPLIAGCDIVLALAPPIDGAAPDDPVLSRALAEAAKARRAREAEGGRGPLIVTLLQDEAIDFALRYGLDPAWAFDRIPARGGRADAFDGDDAGWLAAVGAEARSLAEAVAKASQEPFADLALEAGECARAAVTLKHAAEAERERLVGDAPVFGRVAEGLAAMAGLADADALERLAAVKAALVAARAIARRHTAARTLAAVDGALGALAALELAADARGFPAPTNPAGGDMLDLATPGAAEELRATSAAFTRTAEQAAVLSAPEAAGARLDPELAARAGQVAVESRVAAGLAAASGAGEAAAESASPALLERGPATPRDRPRRAAWRQPLSPLRAAAGRVARAVAHILAFPSERLSGRQSKAVEDLGRSVERVEVQIRRLEALARGELLPQTSEVPTAPSERPSWRPPEEPLAIWREPVDGLDPEVWPEMVTLPLGEFQMGSREDDEGSSDREWPCHTVRIGRRLALGRYPVTFAQWDAARSEGADLPHLNDMGWGRARRPVINVSWEHAQAYVCWLNDRLGFNGRLDAYRLPSEAEWEYACRAGTTTAYWWGEVIEPAQTVYAYRSAYDRGRKGVYRESTTPVGAFKPNPWGLHEMHGNVLEWCEDFWHGDYEGAPDDDSAWLDGGDRAGRVLRGGERNDGPYFLRSAFRNRGTASVRGSDTGFRLARTLSPHSS